jgi:hypothetical protein
MRHYPIQLGTHATRVQSINVRPGGKPNMWGWPGSLTSAAAVFTDCYASRVRTSRKVTAISAEASTRKMAASMPWKAQNLPAGW